MRTVLLALSLLFLNACALTPEQKVARQVRWARIGNASATLGASLFTIALNAAANAAIQNLNQTIVNDNKR